MGGEWESDKSTKNINLFESQEIMLRPVKAYEKSPTRLSESIYRYETNVPSQGWLAFWFEAVFDFSGNKFPISSDTFVVPESFVADECIGTEECHGSLV